MKSYFLFTLAFLIIAPSAWAAPRSGAVLETMDAAGYTYAKVKEGKDEYWIAGPKAVIKVGDNVSYSEQMMMPNFTSKTLNRTFKELMFVGKISTGSSAAAMPASMHGNTSKAKTKTTVDLSNISKAEGGYTIAELFQKKDELKGKVVKVHGRVVKVSNGIMDTNWIHIQDGTGKDGSNNVIFRAKTATANVGDLVLATGTLVTDQDFGFSYQYPVLVENSSFEVSK